MKLKTAYAIYNWIILLIAHIISIWFRVSKLIFMYIIDSSNFASSGLVRVYDHYHLHIWLYQTQNAQNSGDVILMSSFHWDNGKCKLCDQQHISSGIHKCIACFVEQVSYSKASALRSGCLSITKTEGGYEKRSSTTRKYNNHFPATLSATVLTNIWRCQRIGRQLGHMHSLFLIQIHFGKYHNLLCVRLVSINDVPIMLLLNERNLCGPCMSLQLVYKCGAWIATLIWFYLIDHKILLYPYPYVIIPSFDMSLIEVNTQLLF